MVRREGLDARSTVEQPQDDMSAPVRAIEGIAEVLERRSTEVLEAWSRRTETVAGASGARDLRRDGAAILSALRTALEASEEQPDLAPVVGLVSDFSLRRSRQGTRPAETAALFLGLREALLSQLSLAGSSEDGLTLAREAARLVDDLALGSFDSFLAGREDVISQQGEQLLELSTPVVRVWDRVVAAPLVGTLDSARAQVVMESLLQAISDDGALVAILDITGVPTVDTLVAQHLLKTVAATRLMGADCIVSGIAPQTAQTMVQLGIDLSEVTTRASLSDALVLAIARVQAHVDRFAKQ